MVDFPSLATLHWVSFRALILFGRWQTRLQLPPQILLSEVTGKMSEEQIMSLWFIIIILVTLLLSLFLTSTTAAAITLHTAVSWLTNLWVELLFSPGVAVSTVISVVTLRRIAPFITVLYTRTRRWPGQQKLQQFSNWRVNQSLLA